jgi:hypothetical protein
MSDDLRTRIAKVLYNQNAIEDGDHVMTWDEIGVNYQNCWYRNADAVIAELDLGIPCAANGCKVRRIARYHAEKSSQLSPEADDE